ncbi:MAG TPA: hypothetical protein VHB25_21095 [Gemmatimonadaceae bacterium]|nr:hypothetical protein [Gemmatimonadaceae bacterium]
MKRLSIALSVGLCLAAAAPAMAQGRDGGKDSAKKATTIPADARPPKGMCRIWLDNVPATQQPAATDCPTAVKNRPANGRVIFGDDFADSSKKGAKPKLPPGIKGFTNIKTPIVLRKPE